MKLLLSTATLIVTFVIVPSLYGQFVEPDGPVCGTDQAMARMTKEARGQMIASSTAFQATELMIYLHFDGATIRRGFDSASNFTSSIVSGTRNCPAPTLTQARKDEVIKRVVDDYSPFNIVVTTDINEFLAYPAGFREMVLVTTTPSVAGFSSGTGGVSPWAGPGFRIPNSISFVFASLYGNDLTGIASTISHESGHQLGLDHQHLFSSSCDFFSEYHPGFGSGPLAFSPIMGSGFAGGVDNWFAQPCSRNGYTQNDYSMINDQVTVRTDDFPDLPSGSISRDGPVTGVLESGVDIDYVRINVKNPGPVTVSSDNIDLKVTVLNAGGKFMAVYNDPTSTNVSIPSLSGVRYLRIEGESNENMSSEFMTGTYTIIY
jgi:hypothetical protein